ncbi:DedA family protein [Flavisolibacter ginsengisoli]|uniref:Membrane-associated protein n=1 Tax=Flavisolibacter ginsengisoli DSM 18119 TaxID=1121884 RepID=A0A1M5D8K2_9BACT|nr:DedA family protein [Flavisolibacter ginsengisoli]SHF63261.1 membrane-associated protein [Flavisolibacter ginsengisoli DSM 18119]
MFSLLHITMLQGGFIQQFIEWIITNGGLYFLLFVVFAETGLFVGFFLPGDSLLFAAGIYLENLGKEFFGLPYVVIILVIIASFLGNIAGYWFGRKTGPLLYERKETWLFRKKHLLRATEFYHQYGKATIFLAKFLPIIRTFAPIVAGVVKMERPTFIFYNLLGSIAWVCSMMLGGYFLQSWVEREFNFSLKDHIEAITIAIILVTTLPVIYKLFFTKKQPATTTDHNSK